MLSPTYSRMAPPVRHSRSLEGLEQVIPPKMPYSPTRSDFFLNKPLPARPLPDSEYSAMWSDSDSESEATLDTVASPSEPRNSTESYPIFVSSGSDDFTDLVDHPAAVDHILGPIRPSPPFAESHTDTASVVSDVSSLPPSRSDAQYGRPSQWSQPRAGANHYFREKKWDFFPELAPSALQATPRANPNIRPGKTRGKNGRLNRATKRYRWHSFDRAGLGLAVGVRNSIKTYVHRTLSRDCRDPADKNKDIPRPATAPFDEPSDSSADLELQLRAMSVSTMSYTSELDETSRSMYSSRPKQLAVPMSPYQQYGSAIFETPQKAKKINLQQNTREAVRALQGGTSHVLVALDGAKKKIVDHKDDRRREQLKSQIKFVGPVNPHTFAKVHPWV
ncbi:hypothetical protein N7512_006141 [Penicillium capsulatum]|nr:hypothetical protein N7512_006141 [Penicillium capsulatum]